MTTHKQAILSGLFGLCIADALGVPVEFSSRATRQADPVTTMRGYGTWNQPPGTWSDDSSLTLGLVAAMIDGFSLEAIADNFCRWYTDADWTPHGEVFDVGNATQAAIFQLLQGVPPTQSGGTDDRSNGNGALMRILPMAFCYAQLPFAELLECTHQVAGITHAHPRSQMACGIYISIAVLLLQGHSLQTAYQQGIQLIQPFYAVAPFSQELAHFDRILSGAIAQTPIDAIESGGYVVHTLEAALWCLLNTDSYPAAVLQAVNLGGDTDTTAAVTGGVAGLAYGLEAIPAEWLEQLAQKEAIADLAEQLAIALEPAVSP